MNSTPSASFLALQGALAQELFEALPDKLRTRLAELPPVVKRLEEQARRLREAPNDGGSARLASTLAAMEQLRLDLLRLRTGTGSPDDLTRDLDAARAVGDRIGALLDAQREVDAPAPTPASSRLPTPIP